MRWALFGPIARKQALLRKACVVLGGLQPPKPPARGFAFLGYTALRAVGCCEMLRISQAGRVKLLNEGALLRKAHSFKSPRSFGAYACCKSNEQRSCSIGFVTSIRPSRSVTHPARARCPLWCSFCNKYAPRPSAERASLIQNDTKGGQRALFSGRCQLKSVKEGENRPLSSIFGC